jgi:exopolyphosphatase / guanosine-5'-triphosphate,3'-diphosphate pyrophosphatase
MTSPLTISYAAVDLGSNSFHMLVAKYVDGRLQVVDRIKEMIRLASGLDDKHCLTDESMLTAIMCLERFGQRLREIPQINMRAVGTNTLRRAYNGQEFLQRARQALGHPIEIISGREEARLIYLGAAHSVYNETNKRLIVDIGGGSTELIIGKGFNPYYMESLYMGCVSISQRFFQEGTITRKKMRKAVVAARQEMEALEATYKKLSWDQALGSSGTILSIYDVVKAQGWSDGGITLKALHSLNDALISVGQADDIQFDGLPDQRKPVFAGGVAILTGIFESLEIDCMNISDGALREGLLYDLIGRIHDEDIRDNTVADIAVRYNVDKEQTVRVKSTADNLYEQTRETWKLDDKAHLKLLHWSTEIHEIGFSIAHVQYHRHGAYLIANSDLPGFSRQDQTKLACLVQNHRRKFLREDTPLSIEDNPEVIKRLCILLRLSVLLNRSRFYTALPKIRIKAEKNSIKLSFPKNWLETHPLTLADLETEYTYLENAGFTLKYQ